MFVIDDKQQKQFRIANHEMSLDRDRSKATLHLVMRFRTNPDVITNDLKNSFEKRLFAEVRNGH